MGALVAFSIASVWCGASRTLPEFIAARLLQGAAAARARGLVIVAPHVSDEALATLLVNDVRRVFTRGILPLQLVVQEFHVEELLERIARELGVEVWDGRPSVPLVRVAEVTATVDATDVWRRPRTVFGRVLERIGAS